MNNKPGSGRGRGRPPTVSLKPKINNQTNNKTNIPFNPDIKYVYNNDKSAAKTVFDRPWNEEEREHFKKVLAKSHETDEGNITYLINEETGEIIYYLIMIEEKISKQIYTLNYTGKSKDNIYNTNDLPEKNKKNK